MRCYTTYALWYGNAFNSEIIIRDPLNEGEYYDSPSNTFITGRKLINGERFFAIKEIEVYKIQYI